MYLRGFVVLSFNIVDTKVLVVPVQFTNGGTMLVGTNIMIVGGLGQTSVLMLVGSIGGEGRLGLGLGNDGDTVQIYRRWYDGTWVRVVGTIDYLVPCSYPLHFVRVPRISCVLSPWRSPLPTYHTVR